jgi:hypothetical protein
LFPDFGSSATQSATELLVVRIQRWAVLFRLQGILENEDETGVLSGGKIIVKKRSGIHQPPDKACHLRQDHFIRRLLIHPEMNVPEGWFFREKNASLRFTGVFGIFFNRSFRFQPVLNFRTLRFAFFFPAVVCSKPDLFCLLFLLRGFGFNGSV